MGRHSQLDRPAALEDLPAEPQGVEASPAPAPRREDDGPSRTPLSWGETARAVLPAFLVTRLMTLLAGVLGAVFWGIRPAGVYDPGGLTSGLGDLGDRLVAPYARWDAVWFLDIANAGYPTSYEPRTAFFPLYPFVLRVGDFFGSPLVFGLLVSTACAYGGAMLLHRLTDLELGRRAAGMSVWVLMAFPGSLWLTAVYSEGLFLVLSAACLYLARERRWAAVAVVGALAAATRSAGVVLAAPVLVLAWQQWSEDRRGGGRSGDGPDGSRPEDAERPGSRSAGLLGPVGRSGGGTPATAAAGSATWFATWSARPAGPATASTGLQRVLDSAAARHFRGPLLAAAAIVGGLLAFVVALWAGGHSLTVSFDQQREWGRENVGPIEGVIRAVGSGWDGLSQTFGWTPIPATYTPNAQWMNPLLVVFLVVGLAALVGVARRLPPAYAVYVGCALLLPLSAPVTSDGAEPLMSFPRFLAVLFPLAMWAGWWLTRGRWQRTRVAVLGVVGFGLLMLFSELTARWLFVA